MWLASEASDSYFPRDKLTGNAVMCRRQALPEEAFLSPHEAVGLLKRGTRSVLVLSQ